MTIEIAKEAIKTQQEVIEQLVNDRNELMRILANNLQASSQKQLDQSIKEGRTIMFRLTANSVWK